MIISSKLCFRKISFSTPSSWMVLTLEWMHENLEAEESSTRILRQGFNFDVLIGNETLMKTHLLNLCLLATLSLLISDYSITSSVYIL